MNDQDERIVEGSGNVFADLGLPDADRLMVHAELAHLVHTELRARHMTPGQAAARLGITAAEATQLIAGEFVRLPTERLLHVLTALDHDIDIVVRPRSAGQGHARLRVVNADA